MFLLRFFSFIGLVITLAAEGHLRVDTTATACTGCTTVCTIIPPSTASSEFPCYQGTPSDTSKCYYTDPLVLSGSTWSCNICSNEGYPYYVENDPVYTTMQLWFLN